MVSMFFSMIQLGVFGWINYGVEFSFIHIIQLDGFRHILNLRVN